MKYLYFLCCFSFVFLCFFAHFPIIAQDQAKLDSLFELLQGEKNKIATINTLNLIAGEYIASQPLIAAQYAQQALLDAEKSRHKKGIADSYLQLAGSCYYQGNMLKNSEYLLKALPIYEQLNDSAKIAKVLGYLGSVYEAQGNTDKQIEYFHKALQIARAVKDQKFVATLLSNGLGNAYKTRHQIDSALLFHIEALKIREHIQDIWGLANSYLYIGQMYLLQKDYAQTEVYFQKSMDMSLQINDQYGLSVGLLNIGNLYFEQKKFQDALNLYEKSLKIAETAQLKPEVKLCCDKLAQTYIELGKFKEAYQFLHLSVQINDSLNNQDNKKKIAEMQASFEMQQKQRDLERINELKERKNNLQYSGILFFTLLLFSCVFIFGRFNIANSFVEKMLFFSFLLFFEFVILLTDPYIDTLTQREPLFSLLANACIALFIVPLHQFLEDRLKNKWLRVDIDNRQERNQPEHQEARMTNGE